MFTAATSSGSCSARSRRGAVATSGCYGARSCRGAASCQRRRRPQLALLRLRHQGDPSRGIVSGRSLARRRGACHNGAISSSSATTTVGAACPCHLDAPGLPTYVVIYSSTQYPETGSARDEHGCLPIPLPMGYTSKLWGSLLPLYLAD